MIRRRNLACALGAAWWLPSAGAWAQPKERPARVGLVSIGSDPANPRRWQPLRDGMQALGHAEGRGVEYRYAFANVDVERMPALLAALLRDGVDVMVVTGNRETRWAREASHTIPIVMLLVPDPVAQGFVASLARPGGNVTGLTNMVPGMSQKYVELLHEVVPGATRLAVIADPPNPVAEQRNEMEQAARRFGISLHYVAVSAAADLEPAMQQARRAGAGGLIAPIGPITFQHRAAFVEAATRQRLPGMYWDRAFVDAGGLMTYSANAADLFRRAALHVDKLLKGARPGDLPVEQPTKFELVLNLQTAKALGVKIPPSLLLRADEVIE